MIPVSPECLVGKCGNCDGRALDVESDDIVACGHACHGGGGRNG